MAALVWLLLLAPVAMAEAVSPILVVPSTPRGFVELSALKVNTSLSCPEDGCVLEVEQIYHLQNRDRLKGADIGISLLGAADTATSVTITPEAGVSAAGHHNWSLRMNADATKVVRLRYTLPLDSPDLVLWHWDGAALSVWGRMTSARFELRLPWDLPEDQILALEPAAHGFDGRTLYWEYEEPPTLEPFQVWLVAPTLWARAERLRAEGDHMTLARLYRDLGREAERLGAPYPDPYPRVLGELQRAASQDPSPAPHLALAELYLEQADARPELERNYRLLAAEALEQALRAGAQDATVPRQLTTLYVGLAQQTREDGNPEEALHYITLAAEHSRDGVVGDAVTVEEIMLDWAVYLASKGRVTEALVRTADVLSPRIQDALYRYAPPITAARTQVILTDQTRTTSYRFNLYRPLMDRTLARLEELTLALDGLDGTDAAMSWGEGDGAPWAELELVVSYRSLAQLERSAESILQLGGAEPDLIHALIAAPWATDLAVPAVMRNPWVDLYSYQETPLFAPLEALRDEQAQYTTWRLVEASSGAADDERDLLEQQLTALALREQREIWENLSSSSYWSYHVSFEQPSSLPTMSWLVGWGQERALTIDHRHYQWRQIGAHAAIGVGGLMLLVCLGSLIGALGRHFRTKAASPANERR
jgi:tetratricopeptide (TPR) repeat protein